MDYAIEPGIQKDRVWAVKARQIDKSQIKTCCIDMLIDLQIIQIYCRLQIETVTWMNRQVERSVHTGQADLHVYVQYRKSCIRFESKDMDVDVHRVGTCLKP